jgi:hypothetical protein
MTAIGPPHFGQRQRGSGSGRLSELTFLLAAMPAGITVLTPIGAPVHPHTLQLLRSHMFHVRAMIAPAVAGRHRTNRMSGRSGGDFPKEHESARFGSSQDDLYIDSLVTASPAHASSAYHGSCASLDGKQDWIDPELGLGHVRILVRLLATRW